MIYLSLFISFLKVGLFSFGGGLAMLPLIQQIVVAEEGWLSAQTFLDAIAIAQVTPGPIALNVATFSGGQTAGLFGGLVATLGVVLPSFIICLFLAIFFDRIKDKLAYKKVLEIVKLVAIALILSTSYLLWPDSILGLKTALLFLISLGFFISKKLNPALIIVLSGLLGVFLH